MNEELKDRIIETLRDYLNVLYSLANIYCIYEEENPLADVGAEIATLIGDVREVEIKKTEANPSSPIGHAVKIINEGESYTTYTSFFTKNIIEDKYRLRYDYGKGVDKNDSYVIVGEGYHTTIDKKIYVLQNIDTERVYLIGEEGVIIL